jgi:hypothetical protein
MSTGGATLHNKYYRESMKRTRMADGYSKTMILHGHGQSMVEFALILPLMVLIIAGIFDLGRAFYSLITITNAAREGARYGTLHPADGAGIKAAAELEAQNSGITITDGNVNLICPPNPMPPTGCNRGQPLRVTVSYNYNEMIFRFFFPSGINMQRSVEMQVP